MRKSFEKKLNVVMATCIAGEEAENLKTLILDAMCAKYDECIGYGYDKRTAYVIALKVISSYYRDIWRLRKEFIKSLRWEKLWKLLAITITYFVGIILVYLTLSFAIKNSWGWTWSIIVGAALCYFVGLLIAIFSYFRARDRYYIASAAIWGATYVATVGIYLLVSFLTKLWAYTWIMFIAAFAVSYIINMIYLWHHKIRKTHKIDIALIAFAICLTVYFIISFTLKAFDISWLIFIGFVFLLMLFVTIDLLSKKKGTDDDDDDDEDENQSKTQPKDDVIEDKPVENSTTDAQNDNSNEQDDTAKNSEVNDE